MVEADEGRKRASPALFCFMHIPSDLVIAIWVRKDNCGFLHFGRERDLRSK
jgi:hypothetical protein